MDISLGRVAVAAVVNIIVGALWYGPVFGRQWRGMMNLTDEKMKSMPLTAGQAMVGGLVTALVLAYVLANEAIAWAPTILSTSQVSFALSLAFWVWLGYFVTNTFGGYLWEGRSLKLTLFNCAQQFVSLFAMALVLAM
jgi:uncharacterized protein YacL